MKDNLSNRIATGLEVTANQLGPVLFAGSIAGIVGSELQKIHDTRRIQIWADDYVEMRFQDCRFSNTPVEICYVIRSHNTEMMEERREFYTQKAHDQANILEAAFITTALATAALKLSLGRIQRLLLTR